MNKPLATVKNFVIRHKVAIAVTATAVICMKLNSAATQQHDEFLKEHGLYNEFYTPELAN